ncbi:outer membrane protein assembly factor BamC [Lampropedia puyangensis]|uniref:Outer membrane protein assembly factor BamC n=2 Tax=Lampropedia puyangensis TaxID=1330072 RepID=A0A4S8FE80_9BURK|nr:outer membrane protein assembly factor BamC [Lampropedia puyangensis]THU05529.1 outer membrane protein assembly factor BamC [Lampropedia puyangensis]
MSSKSAAFTLSLAATAAVLSGCSVLQNDKIDYKSASRGTSLEVPPDLTQLSTDARYNVPGGAVSANALLATQIRQGEGDRVASDQVADVQIHREGNVRWLSVPRAPDVLWEPVRQFWADNGFVLVMDQAAIGIMETDWAENRAKLPQDFIRNSLGRVLDSLYSTGERDKFRTRLERRSDGGTDIYITHRGMVEEYSNRAQDSTIWVPRDADPELETEFLRRLMVQLGVSEEQSNAIVQAGLASGSVTAGAAPSSAASTFAAARMVTLDAVPALELQDDFDRAWRRVGTALDRTGFTVEDRDRSQGLYFVRYIAPDAEREKPGFFGRVFGQGSSAPAPVRYRLVVKNQGQLTHVQVQDEAGNLVPAGQAQGIIKLLYEDMR